MIDDLPKEPSGNSSIEQYLAQITRWLRRNRITGAYGSIKLTKTPCGVLIGDDKGSGNGKDGVSDIGVFKIAVIDGDVLNCQRIYFTSFRQDPNGSTYSEITIEEAITRISKPYLIRSSTRIDTTYAYTYSSPTRRKAIFRDEQYNGAYITEEVFPAYLPEDLIVAAHLKGMTALGTVEWMDLNVDARCWRVVPLETEICLNGVTKKSLVYRSELYETPQ
jgi:hypothetical protein